MGLLSGIVDRADEGSMFIDADSLLYSSCHQFRDDWDIEIAYMNFMERIGTIRTECYNQVIKLNELIIGFTSKTNFRYDLLPSYKSNREKSEISERAKELKMLVYKRVKKLVQIDRIFEADDLAIQYADKGYMIAAIDKDVVNAITTRHYNYKKGKWSEGHSKEDINKWYLIQTIVGDTSDGWNFVKGMGMVKATEFVDKLLEGDKTFNDYIDLFETPSECLLANQICRMNQYNKSTGKLKLITMEEVIACITPF